MSNESWLLLCAGWHLCDIVQTRQFLHALALYVQVLIGNKCDMDEHKRVVPYSKGQALADEYRIQFFETSAKNNIRVEEVRPSAHHCQSALVTQQSYHPWEPCCTAQPDFQPC